MIKFIRITMICLLILIILLTFIGAFSNNEYVENDDSIETGIIITTNGDIGVGVVYGDFGLTTNGECGVAM